MDERSLATIQKIDKLELIPNADTIEKATILGWELVVKKGEFKVGDLCVYCEIDSILPEKPEFEFLRDRKFRIKTIKLRGQISQGIAFPLSILPPGDYPLQTDVTELLDIKKYEVPIPAHLAGYAKGNFPSFLRKTDEVRIQSYPGLLDEYKDVVFYTTEKLDGTSFTFYCKGEDFGVCSRRLELKETDDNVYWIVAKKYNLHERISKLGINIAIQGEIIGPGIQKNKYSLKDYELFVFSVFDIDSSRYYNCYDFITVINRLELKMVPLLSTDFRLNFTVNELVILSEGKSIVNPKIQREGIVFRPIEEMQDYKIGRLSFKVINPKFLLDFNE
jgi:RNA ligase (TIGR02306 family)